jgi:hypothetical protein
VISEIFKEGITQVELKVIKATRVFYNSLIKKGAGNQEKRLEGGKEVRQCHDLSSRPRPAKLDASRDPEGAPWLSFSGFRISSASGGLVRKDGERSYDTLSCAGVTPWIALNVFLSDIRVGTPIVGQVPELSTSVHKFGYVF